MKQVLVIGYARSGKYATLLLHKHGYQVTVTDAKKIVDKQELEQLGIMVYEDGHPDKLKEIEWEFIVKNPGIPYSVPFVAHFVKEGTTIYNEIEIASWFAAQYQYAAITGTNGKTTTTTLLGEMLKLEFKHTTIAGNIGIPLSEVVYYHETEPMKIALEISAFQLIASPSFHAEVAVILNLTPDHLDYFSSLEDYYQAKLLVTKNMQKNDWFLRNIDDSEIVRRTSKLNCKVVDFSVEKEADLFINEGWVVLYETKLFQLNDLKLVGKHNIINSMVAAAMAYKLGVFVENIQSAIQNFSGVEHRIEYVATINQVKYYNDSKATNVDSAIVALNAFKKPVILLAGGYDKKTGFKDLENYTDKMKELIVYGETKEQLKFLKEDAHVVETLEEAVKLGNALAKPGDIILFSPACASYDQFNNFEERGRVFKSIVLDLLGK